MGLIDFPDSDTAPFVHMQLKDIIKNGIKRTENAK